MHLEDGGFGRLPQYVVIWMADKTTKNKIQEDRTPEKSGDWDKISELIFMGVDKTPEICQNI